MIGHQDAVDAFDALRKEFHKVAELPIDSRSSYLDALQKSDAHLHQRVLGLLAHMMEADLLPATGEAAPVIVGPFKLLRSIGRGGMGEVFLAERCSGGFEQRVALKRVRHGALSSGLVERFLRERQLLARLSHPNIARLIDGGVDDDGQPWLAMEFIDGERITDWVQTRQLDVYARVALLRRIGAAVAFAHSHLIVHRDIKPANILVGVDGEPKLLDFGIAKLLDDSDVDATQTGARALTVRYAAPEQISGDRTTTTTDVYAMGVLLFELTSGHSPYAAAESGRSSWSQSVLTENAQTLSQAAGMVSRRKPLFGDLDRIVRKAMTKEPQERYPSVLALNDDLADWLADRALRSGIGGTRARSRQLLKQYRWPLALAASAMLALTVGLLLALREGRIAEHQTRSAQANLSAMLGVLGGANRRDYLGREPAASEFLVMAAGRLQHDFGDDPALIRDALGEIGHGLINMGHEVEAEPILVAAIDATERMPDTDADAQVGLYKLLVITQIAPEARVRAEVSAQRISELAALASPDIAIDALSSAAGILSIHGLFDLCTSMYDRADTLMARAHDLRPSAEENFWRQRGWVAWRAYHLDAALSYLSRSATLMVEHPAEFSALRKAETQLLLADVELARGNADAAQTHLFAARPTIEHEYPEDHSERASLHLQTARLVLLKQDSATALNEADAALRILDKHHDEPIMSEIAALWLRAESLSAQQDCAAAYVAAASARALMEREPQAVSLPRDANYAEQGERAVIQRCAQSIPDVLGDAH